MNKLKLGILLLAVLLFSNTGQAEGIEFEKISLEQAIKKAKKQGKPIFIDIFATWCGPCKTLSKTTFKDADLGAFMNEHFINIKLDGELEDGAELMEKFDLGAYPTMLFLSADVEMLRMIEGLVPAETVQEEANAVVFPESTPIFQLSKRFEEGDRGQKMMQELIHESLLEDKEHEAFVEEYMRLFPELDLDNTDEFIVFGAGTNDLDNENVKTFLADAEHFSEVHENLAEWKITLLIIDVVSSSKAQGDIKLMESKMEQLFPAYEQIMGENALSKPELLGAMHEIYNEE